MKNIKSFDFFNEKKEELNHKTLSKEIKNLKKKRDQLLVVRPKKEKDTDIIELNNEIKNKEKELKSIKENHDGGIKNYMFFGNLQTIKRLVDEMLEMNETELDSILTEHDWASDHISVATENIEHVFNFLAGNNSDEEKHEEKPLGEPEEDNNIKGFEDFQ